MPIFVSIRHCPNISNKKTLETYFFNLSNELKLITRHTIKGSYDSIWELVTVCHHPAKFVEYSHGDSEGNFNLSRDLTKPPFLFQMVMCFESNSLTKGYHAAKFGDFRYCGSNSM